MSKSVYTKEYQKIIKRLKKARLEAGLKQIESILRNLCVSLKERE